MQQFPINFGCLWDKSICCSPLNLSPIKLLFLLIVYKTIRENPFTSKGDLILFAWECREIWISFLAVLFLQTSSSNLWRSDLLTTRGQYSVARELRIYSTLCPFFVSTCSFSVKLLIRDHFLLPFFLGTCKEHVVFERVC